jgi:hypothetical protein
MVRFDDLLEANYENLRRELDLIGVPEMESDDMRILPPILHGMGCLAASQQPSA